MPIPTSPPESWVAVILVLLSGGGAKFLYDTYKDWRNQPSPAAREVASVEASIVTIARARDELEEDNRRIRLTLHEERTRWDQERARYESERAGWQDERIRLRAEIVALEQQIRAERDEAARRYDSLLARVAELSARHAPQEPS